MNVTKDKTTAEERTRGKAITKTSAEQNAARSRDKVAGLIQSGEYSQMDVLTGP